MRIAESQEILNITRDIPPKYSVCLHGSSQRVVWVASRQTPKQHNSVDQALSSTGLEKEGSWDDNIIINNGDGIQWALSHL
jgi:hypothetical protein